MPKFVSVYAKATGRKQLVPEHFLTNPALKDRFELTPSARAADNQGDDEPDEVGDKQAAVVEVIDPDDDSDDHDPLTELPRGPWVSDPETTDDTESPDETPA